MAFAPNPNLGMNDPSLLPLLMGQHMTPGMTPGPVPSQALTPGFRAPGLPSAPGMQQPQQPAGMGLGQGAMMLGMGLRGYKSGPSAPVDPTGAARTQGDGDLGGYSKPGGMVDMGDGTFQPNPNDPASYAAAPGAAAGGGGFSDMLAKLGLSGPKGLF